MLLTKNTARFSSPMVTSVKVNKLVKVHGVDRKRREVGLSKRAKLRMNHGVVLVLMRGAVDGGIQERGSNRDLGQGVLPILGAGYLRLKSR